MLELAITIAIIWFGLCVLVAVAINNRIDHNEHMARRISNLMQR